MIKKEGIKPEIDNSERTIQHLQRIFDNLGQYWRSIELLLGHVSKPLLVDDKGLVNTLRYISEKCEKISEKLDQTVLELSKVDIKQTLSEVKFIGKKVYEIEGFLKEIKEKGISKNIELDFRIDGYQLVKKPTNYDENEILQGPQKSDDELIYEILNLIPNREAKAIIHRIGLFGEPKKTFEKIGNMFHISKQTANLAYKRGLRRLRRNELRVQVSKIKNQILRKEIGIEDE